MFSFWKRNQGMLQFQHDYWLQLGAHSLFFVVWLSTLHCSSCESCQLVSTPWTSTLSAGYRELSFCWQNSLRQARTLTWHYPVFCLSQASFLNCLVILLMEKAEEYTFVWFTKPMAVFSVNCIDVDINLMKNVNNFFF